VAFDPDEMKAAGCCVSVGHDGRPSVERGLVRKEDRKGLAKGDSGSAPEGGKPQEEHSEALRRDLAAYRLQVAQAELARHPEVAFDLLVFHVASGLLGLRPPTDGPNATFTPGRPAPAAGGETAAAGRLEAADQALPTAWLKPAREAERFAVFRRLTDAEKRGLLAYCTAVTLRPKLAAPDARDATAYDVALSLTGASVADFWRPTKENYLGRVPRERLLEVGRELFGRAWADSRRKEKKGALADALHEAFADPERHGKTPEAVAKLKRWLPAGMAFGTVTETKKRKARKTKKAR
jgi:ParB family chromosome partitioning protein